MVKTMSQDIKILFSAFDMKKCSYNELSEIERYNKVKTAWNALDLLSKSRMNDNKTLNKSSEILVSNKEPA